LSIVPIRDSVEHPLPQGRPEAKEGPPARREEQRTADSIQSEGLDELTRLYLAEIGRVNRPRLLKSWTWPDTLNGARQSAKSCRACDTGLSSPKDPRDAQRVLPQQQSGLRAFFIASLFREREDV